MTQDSDDLLAMVFSAPIHLPPTQVKNEGGEVVVTRTEGTHIETHETVIHGEGHHTSSFHQETHESHSDGRQLEADGNFEESSVVESASAAMSTATSVSVRSSVSQQQFREPKNVTTSQTYTVTRSQHARDDDETSVTVISSHGQIGEASPTVESEASTTVAPVRSPDHDAVIEQFKNLRKIEAQNRYSDVRDESTEEIDVTSEKLIRFGFSSNFFIRKHSHSSQEALDDLPVLVYQELEYVPLHTLQMPSESSVHAEHREGTTTSGGEVVTTYDNQSDDEPFTFEKVEYGSEHEQASEPIVTEIVHEKKIVEEVHSSTSHQSSTQEVRQQKSQQSHSSGAQQYQPYGDVKESSKLVHQEGEIKELVPHLVGPRVRDNPRPVMIEPGAYKITKYEFKSKSNQQNEATRQIISDTEESSKRHSQSRHTHKEHHHHRQMDSESAFSDTTDDVEIRTQMHLSPASTLVRQSTRPDPDLPPSTGAVKMLRDRIELGGSDTEHKEVKQIDIYESLNEPKEDHKVEDIPRAEVNEQHRHTFHELYYHQQPDKPVTQERHHFRNSTGVSSYDDHARHQAERHEEIHLRHVGEATEKQTTQQHHEQVNVRRSSEAQSSRLPYDETTGYVTRTTDQHTQKGSTNQYHEFQHVNLRNVEQARRESSHHYNELEHVNLRNVYQPQGETTKRYDQTVEHVNVHRTYQPYQKEQMEHMDESVQVNIHGATQPAQRGSTNQYHEFQQVNLRSTQPTRRETYNQTVEQVNVRSAYPYQKETSGRQSQYSTDQTYQQKQITQQVTHTHDVSHTAGQGAVTKQTTYTTRQPAEKLQCTCNNCAIHGRHSGPATTTVTKRTDEVQELSYKPYQKPAEHVVQTATRTGTSSEVLQKTSAELQDDSRTHKRTTSIHRIEDVHSTGGGIHVSGVVGNLVDTRTAQGELYTSRSYAPQEKQQHTSSPMPSSPTAVARISRPYDDKFNSVRVVRNVRAFVNEWGQKDFVPPGGVPQLSSPKAVVSPTFTETTKVTEVRNVTSPVQKVVVPTATAPRSNYVTRTDVTKQQTIVKTTETRDFGKGSTVQQQFVSTTPAPVPAKRESVVVARARPTSPPSVTGLPLHHHEFHCCCCPYYHYQLHREHFPCEYVLPKCEKCEQLQQQQQLHLQHSYKPTPHALANKSGHSQPMLKYESYTTQKVEERPGAQHHLQHEEHRDQAEEEESFTLVPVSVRRADYESKSGQTKKKESGRKPMIDVFSV